MIHTFNRWSDVNKIDLKQTVDMVITGGKIESLKCDDILLNHIGTIQETKTVLDFGYGIGRNIFEFSIKRPNWKFVGYDNPSMINKSEEYSLSKFNRSINTYDNIVISYDWSSLTKQKFDCIYATLVFQHIHENDLNAYISNIKNMTKRLLVFGRRFNDDVDNGVYKNTYKILENNGLYPSNTSDIGYTVDGNPHDHIFCVYDL